MEIADKLLFRFQARYPIIWLESFDDPRVYQTLKEVSKAEDYNLYRWTMVDGLMELGLTLDTTLPVGDTKMDAQQMLSEILNRMDSYEKELFVMEGIGNLISYMEIKILLKKIATEIFKSRKPMHLVLFSPIAQVPQELARYIDVIKFPACDKQDYGMVLDRVAKGANLDLSQSLREKLVDAAEGLTTLEAERVYSLAGSETYFEDNAVEVVRREKGKIGEKLDELGLQFD